MNATPVYWRRSRIDELHEIGDVISDHDLLKETPRGLDDS